LIDHVANGNVRAVYAPVCITGIGVVSPLGATRDRFRDRLLAGETGVRTLTGFEPKDARSRLAAQVRDFDATQWIPPMKLRRMDESAQFAIVAVREAFADAGYPLTDAGDDRAGVVLGTFSAGGHATADFLNAYMASGPAGAPALLFNSTVANAAASSAGLELKLRGPNTTVSQKETSGLSALATATDFILDERADAIAAGGVDAVYESFYRAHDSFGVYATEAVKPFDAQRSGFVLGEGAYVLVTESETSAASRGKRPYAMIAGIGAAGDSIGTNAWPSDGRAIARTIRLALEDAGVDATMVDLVYASANGAPGLDEVEAAALSEVFGDRPRVTSLKGAIGESGAASAASCVAACLCGQLGRVPPVTGLTSPGPAASRLHLVRSAENATSSLVLINGVASGGALLAVVLRIPQ
jgi:3-oxoacyl-[acyl-carrier-protein] synthase II